MKIIKTIKIAVFISGNGSNLQALIDGVQQEIISNAQISLVVSNKQDAYGLKRAEAAGIQTYYADRREFSDNEEYDRHLADKLKAAEIDLILLAGYLRILTRPLLEAYEDRILNIHPSLLPDFGGSKMYGMRVHEAVINAGMQKSGCSVHLVNEEVDGGTVIAQTVVPVNPDDTAEILASRILEEEHRLYPETVNKFIIEKL